MRFYVDGAGPPPCLTSEIFPLPHSALAAPQPAAIPFDLDLSNQAIMAQTEELCQAKDGFAMAGARRETMRRMMDT